LPRTPRADDRPRRGPPAPERAAPHPDPTDRGPHRRARPRRPASPALHLDLERGRRAVGGALGGGQPDGRQPRVVRRHERALSRGDRGRGDHRLGRGEPHRPRARRPRRPAVRGRPRLHGRVRLRRLLHPDERRGRRARGGGPSAGVRRDPLGPDPRRRAPGRCPPRTRSRHPVTPHGAAGRDDAAGFLAPAYGGRSLGDVLPAVAHALGAGSAFARPGLELPPAPQYVVYLVDGLGADLLAAHADDAPYLHSLLAESSGPTGLTAGVPSTTATSLTSLGTALTPGEHGMIGFSSRIPGTDELLFSLMWD